MLPPSDPSTLATASVGLCFAACAVGPHGSPLLDGAPPAGSPPDPVAVVATAARSAVLEPAAAAATRAEAERYRRILRELSAPGRFALGHQDGLAYGVGWAGDPTRSDVGDVCGSPAAVHGWDLFRIELGAAKNGDGVPFELLRERLVASHQRGALNTLSWHADNPVSGGDAWDTTSAVARVLPGGSHHALFRAHLGRVADFLASLRGPRGELVPVLFRPFHEHNGGWFWWGEGHASREEYIALFRMTVDTLRREHGLGHLLFAYSPGAGGIRREEDYLERYPGDDVVDVFGLDDYFESPEGTVRAVELVVSAAAAHGKIAALTEFGRRGGLGAGEAARGWLGASCLEPLLESPVASRIAYALAWRNADAEHSFLPHAGHPAAAEFAALCAGPGLLLERDLAR